MQCRVYSVPCSDLNGLVSQLLSQVQLFCDPMDCSPPILCPWDSPGKNTGVGCHFLLQRIFLTQGSNPHLLHWPSGFFYFFLHHRAFREAQNGKEIFFKGGIYVYLQLIHFGAVQQNYSKASPVKFLKKKGCVLGPEPESRRGKTWDQAEEY